jgi:hypothetical protein
MTPTPLRRWFRRRASATWPPYEQVERSLEREAHERMAKLERLYHKGQNLAWDGRAVLSELIAKHGAPRLAVEQRESAQVLLGTLLWGELAAWAISAELAEQIDDVEAKMAATSQAHDEARHFYVLRDYLHALGEPIPRLGFFGRQLLVGILESDSLVHKLIGMQLLVESNALSIFRALADARIEPVLSELLPYYERDEARHVGLGVMYLPRLLAGLTRRERLGVQLFQLRCIGLLIGAGQSMHEHFRALGMEPRSMAEHTLKLQEDIMRDMRRAGRGDTGDDRATLGGLSNPRRGIGPKIFDFIHPPEGGEASAPTTRVARRILGAGARALDQALAS